jgi:hypothetical protein
MNKMTLGAAVEARMTRVLLLVGVAATTLAVGTQAQAACNIRGEHCGRPAWAANALSGRFDRVPDSALEPPKHYQVIRKPIHIERVERVIKKAAPEQVVKKVVPLVKFADGEGRQFDPTSQVWFDGESQCWSGAKQFTFKDGDWFYGKKMWVESNDSWKVSSGDSPELVSCESVPSFAAKAKAFTAKMAAPSGKIEKAENADKGATSQPTPATPAPSKIKTAESDTSSVALKPATTPASAECKKYFASVGQMITVPCAE